MHRDCRLPGTRASLNQQEASDIETNQRLLLGIEMREVTRQPARHHLPELLGGGDRERRVLELRYGLGGEHPRTLDEVGRTFNVTRERIRQIENQSLKKLQSLAEAQKLRDVA